jgi:hypothetical protein
MANSFTKKPSEAKRPALLSPPAINSGLVEGPVVASARPPGTAICAVSTRPATKSKF